MGREKGLTELNGRKLITYAIEALRPVVSRTIIIANDPVYREFGLPVHKDLIPGQGPLGGIYTGLFFARNIVLFLPVLRRPFF